MQKALDKVRSIAKTVDNFAFKVPDYQIKYVMGNEKVK